MQRIGFCATIVDYLFNKNLFVLRARYDIHGNIILGSIVHDAPSPEPTTEPTPSVRAQTWTMVEETHREVRLIQNPEPLREPKQQKPSVFHNVGTKTKQIIRESVAEGAQQIQHTAKDAGSSIESVQRSLANVPRKASAGLKSFWKVANTPVSLPGRKPGARQPRKLTLFAIDTVRFGGTFGVIFAVLFVGINYQSFWQIARAELALGGDIQAEQALSDITEGSSALKAFRASQTGGRENILAYLPAVGPYEDRIIIPKLNINAPIVRPSMGALMKEDWIQFENDIQTALRDGVVHYPGSARPGQAGNFFVTGHSSYYPWDNGKYKNIFARLHELDVGDTYSVYYGGDRHTYRITKKYEVKPSDVSVLDQPTTQRLATLMTCTPIGTTLRRLIVLAEEIEPSTGDVLAVGEKTSEAVANPFIRLDALPI